MNIFFSNNPECKYLVSIEDYNSYFSNVNDIYFFHLNIRSVNKNFDTFLLYLNNLSYKPDFIVLTEAWIQTGVSIHLYSIRGYNIVFSCNDNRSGGVIVYYKEGLSCNKMDSSVEGADSLLLYCRVKQNTFYLLAIYRWHEISADIFLDRLSELLGDLGKVSTILLGDINIDIKTSSVIAERYLDSMSSFGFENLINIDTRVTDYSSTCIDHVFFRGQLPLTLFPAVLDLSITDHRATCLAIRGLGDDSFTQPRNYKKINLSKLFSLLLDEDWKLVYNSPDVNLAFDELYKILYFYSEQAVEVATRSNLSHKNRKLKPWMTEGLLLAINIRDKLYKKMKRFTNDVRVKESFKLMKSKISLWIKMAKSIYYNNLFLSVRGNSRKQWSIINEVTGRSKQKSRDINLKVGDTLVSDQKEIARIFNNYFINVAESITNNLPPLSPVHINEYKQNFPPSISNRSIFLTPVAVNEVLLAISRLSPSKSPGIDGITAKLVKEIGPIIAPVLAFVFNKSLSEGVFPDKLKKAKVVPIPKKGNSLVLDNYRPISLLPIFSKLFEKLVKFRIINFLNLNKFFSESQFGFREGLGTEMALNKFLTRVYSSINNKNIKKTSGLFLDIRKAFDTVDHGALLDKLWMAGVRGVALEWFRSYLSGRSQVVSLGGDVSDNQPITCGVPQGSVLGPLLFLIFVNDLCNGPFKGSLTAFADDTAIAYGAVSVDQLYSDMQHDLGLLSLWFTRNKLVLNASKSVYINFSLAHSFEFVRPLRYHDVGCPLLGCDCEPLKQVTKFKYLGIILEENLLFKDHIKELKNYSRLFLNRFYYLKYLCPKYILKQMYISLIHSRFAYGISFWGSTYLTHLRPLISVQKSLMCTIAGGISAPNRYRFFSHFSILPVRSLYIYKVLLQFFYASGNPGPTIDTDANITTRNITTLRWPRPNSTFFQKTFIFLQPKFYNKLPNDILNFNSFKILKLRLRSFLLSLSEDEIEGFYHVLS